MSYLPLKECIKGADRLVVVDTIGGCNVYLKPKSWSLTNGYEPKRFRSFTSPALGVKFIIDCQNKNK